MEELIVKHTLSGNVFVNFNDFVTIYFPCYNNCCSTLFLLSSLSWPVTSPPEMIIKFVRMEKGPMELPFNPFNSKGKKCTIQEKLKQNCHLKSEVSIFNFNLWSQITIKQKNCIWFYTTIWSYGMICFQVVDIRFD